MKHLILLLPVTIIVAACSGPTTVRSSSDESDAQQPNAAIKQGVGAKITGSAVYQQDKEMHGQGAMQKGLDTWLKEDWEPTFADENKAAPDGDSDGAVENKKDKVEKAASAPETGSSKTDVNKASATELPTTQSTKKSSKAKSTTAKPATTKQPDHFTLQYYYDRFHKYLNKKAKKQ